MSELQSQLPSAVSVIIPLYNKGLYIRQALGSVLAQTFHNFEVIVVNDGSTDDGPQIVRQIQDPRVRIVDQPNSGVSAARNRGISEAGAEHVAFLDADDEWLPDFLETVLGLADRYPDAGAYATGYVLLKGGQGVYRKITVKGEREKCGCFFDLLGEGAGVWTSSSIAVRRSVFDHAGAFRTGYKLGEDLDMWFRIGLYYPFACSPKICALYRYGQPDNACCTTEPMGVPPLYVSLLELKRDGHVPAVVKRKAIAYLSHQLEKDIAYLLVKGFRDVAQQRMHLYRKQFGVNLPYIKLCMFSMLPMFFLSSVTSIRLMFVRSILKLRSMTMKAWA